MGLVKNLFAFAAVGILGLVGSSFSSSTSNSGAGYQYQPDQFDAKTLSATYPDPAAVELTSEDISVTLVSSTTTECSQSYQVSFSTSYTIYKNRQGSVYILVTDSAFTKQGDYPEVTDDQIAAGETIPEFEAKVFYIKGTGSTQGDVIIPRYLQFTTRFKMHVTGFYSPEAVDSYSNIKTVLLHDDIETIPENTFVGVPDTVQFKCMSSEAKSGWADGWTDSTNITYGYTPTDAEVKTMDTTKVSTTTTAGTGKDFLIGYLGEGQYNLPLVMTYDVKKADGTIENRNQELTIDASKGLYDAVGENLGVAKTSKMVDIRLGTGESVDSDSIIFYNIYKFTRDANQAIIPDLASGSFFAKAVVSFGENYDLSDFATYRQGRASSYAGYTQIDMSFDRTPGIYERLKASVYQNNLSDIEKGVLTIRYRLTSLSTGKYRIVHKENGESVTSTIKVDTPVDYVNLNNDKNNEVGFILQDQVHDVDKKVDYSFSGFSSIESMELIGLYFTVDMFKPSTGAIITKSSVSVRFGIVPMISDPALSNYTNINAMMIIAALIYIVVFAAGSVGYYFYKKWRFKNDEFRRVKPKLFLKNSIKNGVGFGLILLSILYIIARFNIMDTSVVAYNPLDVYVIIFTVAGAIFLGVAIKDAVFSIRDNKERKRAIKLHLGNDVVDDGTGTK